MKTILAGVIAAAICTGALAAPLSLPTGPFLDAGRHENSRNGAVNTLSADGHYAVYDIDHAYSMADGTTVAVSDIVVYDKILGTTTQITWGNRDSYGATISADGRYIAFVSESMDFSLRNKSVSVPDVGAVTNPGPHVYLADLRTDLGHVVTPTTYQMVDTSVLDQSLGCRAVVPTSTACTGGDAPATDAAISGDGSYVAFSSSALNLDADLSPAADDLSRIYLWQRSSRTSQDATAWADGNSDSPSLSYDASKVAFASTATNLVTPIGTTVGGNIFVWNRTVGTTRLASATGTTLGNGPSWSPAINADGTWIAYTTLSDNLDSHDNNGRPDVYAYEIASGRSYAVSVTRLLGKCKDGATELTGGWKPICVDTVFPPEGGTEPSISADGRYIAFMSESPLINQTDDKPGCDSVDHNDRMDIYVADMANGGEVTLQTMLHDSTGKLWATPNGESRYPSISANGRVISFETSNSAFYLPDFETIADPLYTGDGAPKVLLVDGLQRRSCP